MNYRHPWNVVTFAGGLASLIAGSYYYEAPDWDVPINVIMAVFTYISAAWSLDVLVKLRWRKFPLMMLATWWSVDGCYSLYWHFINPGALELMRQANAPVSLVLYWACGVFWSIPDIWKEKAWKRSGWS